MHLKGEVEAQFHDVNGNSGDSAQVRMKGKVDTKHQTASVNLWIDGMHHHLVTSKVRKGEARSVARKALTAISIQDWPTVYGLLASQLKSDLTETQFIEIMASQTTPQILSWDLSSKGQVSSSLGFTYFAQPITVEAQKLDGTTITFSSNVYLVLEQGQWHLLSTDAASES